MKQPSYDAAQIPTLDAFTVYFLKINYNKKKQWESVISVKTVRACQLL